ncbi:hypothetical protein PK69_24695 [Xanthomonas phaseoli pv. phaseoli]|nr:hypothetical protein PK69_24695 [Xanthomonas phaseoli pv. phaseoli]
MARWAVDGGHTNIRHACRTFAVSETCFRYQAKASEENARIADWLVRLTTTYRDWGFGLCFLHLRNVKGFGWNHKRVVIPPPISRRQKWNFLVSFLEEVP